MEYFDKLYHKKDSRLRKVLDSVTFERFMPWNTKAAIASWKDYMKEIYHHVDSDYIGSSMVDFLDFIEISISTTFMLSAANVEGLGLLLKKLMLMLDVSFLDF
ncbi:unnamed protein product [Prunus brigantina]